MPTFEASVMPRSTMTSWARCMTYSGMEAFVCRGETDEVGRLGVVADQEPRVDRDAVAADARAGVEDVHARVLVGDADDLGDVHAADAADLGELVGEGDVHRAEGVLDDLGHLGGADVGDGDLALAEAGVDLRHGLAHLGVVGADGAGCCAAARRPCCPG